MKDSQIVGVVLAEVLPQTSKSWYQQSHLLKLNLLLLVPLLSSSVAGYDGNELSLPILPALRKYWFADHTSLNALGSLMNGLQSLHQWRAFFGQPAGVTFGLVNAAQSIGSVLALPMIGWLADTYGRRAVLLAGILLVIIATIIQTASVNLPMFVVSRLVVGFGGMFAVHPSPMLIAELAFPTHRGKYTCAFWTMYYLGAILASWTTFGCQNYETDWSWRIPSLLQAGFPLIQLVFWWWVPESPRWLVAQDRTAEAMALLSKYHAGESFDAAGVAVANDQQPSRLVRYEMDEIVQAIQLEKVASATGWGALVSTPGNRRRTLIAFLVGFMAQWNGIAVVSYYLALVLDTIGIRDTFRQTLINGLLQIFNFGAALSAAFLVDRLGRRTLFLWSGVGMLLSYVVWTACSAVVDAEGSKPAGVMVVVCLFTFYFHYDISYTPLLFGYPTEILPYNLRAKGLAVELFAIYGSLNLMAFVNPIGLDQLGWRYYIVFVVLLAVFLPLTWFLFPETKGHSLEEIAVLFDGPQATGGVARERSDADDKKILSDIEHQEHV
ncbi:General substrate transporter [Apiospora saccharicola]